MDMPTNNNNGNGGYPPARFHSSSNQDSDSGDTEEDRVSFINESNASDIALQLSRDTPELRSLIQDLLQGDRTLEITDNTCTTFNATPDGPKYTCSLVKGDGQRCATSFTRLDRFKHHLQGHLRITPYSCMDSSKPTAEPKCGRRFTSVAARDTHVKNKGGPVMHHCGTSVLPKNFARHRTTCSICSNPVAPHL